MSVFCVMVISCYRFDKIHGGRHGGLDQYLSYHRHVSYNSWAPLRAPSFREQRQTLGLGASLQGHCFPIACALETSPLPPDHRFRPTWVSPLLCGGLVCTSSLPWPPMVLRGSITALQVLPADRRQLVPGRWTRGPGCGSQSSGGLRQLHPLPRLQVPSIQGDVLAMPPAGFLQGPGCDLGRAVVMAPGKDKGRAGTWGSPPLKPEQL